MVWDGEESSTNALSVLYNDTLVGPPFVTPASVTLTVQAALDSVKGLISAYFFNSRNDIPLFNDAILKDGTEAIVKGSATVAYSKWYLSKVSTVTVDGTSALATLSGVGRWLRKAIMDFNYINVNNWLVDPVAGNDENIGGALAPIKTLKEWWNRTLSKYTQFSLMTLNAAVWPATDPWVYPAPSLYGNAGLGTSTPFILQGLEVINASGTFTAVGVAFNSGLVDGAAKATDSTRTWITFKGQFIKVTSGAAATAYSAILAEPVLHTSRGTTWVKQSFGSWTVSAPPANGTTYDIVNFTQINISVVPSDGEGIFIIQNFNVTPNFVFSRGAYPNNRRVWWGTCIFTNGLDDNINNSGRVSQGGIFYNCLFVKGTNSNALAANSGFYECVFGGSLDGPIQSKGGCRISLIQFVNQNGGLSAQENGSITANSIGVYDSAIAYDFSKSGTISVLTGIMGNGNTTVAKPRTRGTMHMPAGYTPLTTGTLEIDWIDAGDIILNPIVIGAAVPAVWAGTLCNTWAAFIGVVFNRVAMSFTDYSCIEAG